MYALANSMQLGRQVPKQNILEDLFGDQNLQRRSGGVEYQPDRNRIESPIILPLRQGSLDKNKLLSISRDIVEMKKKLNKEDQKDNKKYSKAEHSQKNRPSRVNSTSLNLTTEIQQLQQKVQLLTFQLKQQKAAHVQKQDFYRQLLANQEQEMAALELSLEAQKPLHQLTKTLHKTDQLSRILRQEVEQKINIMSDRIIRLSSAAKKCKNMVRSHKKRSRSKSHNSDIQMLKDRQIESIMSEYEKIQRKLQEERKELQLELQAKKDELEQQRSRFDEQIQKIKQKYTQLLNESQQRHAKSLERCYQQLMPREDIKQQKKHKQAQHKLRYLEIQNNEKQQNLQKLQFQNESLKQSLLQLEREKSAIQLQLDKLNIQRQSNNVDMEVLASTKQSEFIIEELQNIKNINQQLKAANSKYQKQNFELSLKLKKQQELERRIDKMDRDQRDKMERQQRQFNNQSEIATLKSQLGQLKRANESWQSEMTTTINNIATKDPFLQLLRAQYTGDTQLAAIQVIKALNNIVEAKQKQEETIKQTVAKMISLKDFYSTHDIVQQLIKSIHQERYKNQRDRNSWLAIEQKLIERNVRMQQKMKKVEKPKQDNTAVQLKYQLSRKDNELKQLNNKIEVQQFELLSRNQSYEEQLERREKLLADKDMMIEELKKRIQVIDSVDKVEVVQKIVTNNEPLEQQIKKLKLNEIELHSNIQRLKEQNKELQQKYDAQIQQNATKSAKIQILTQFQKQQTEKSYDMVKERQKAASQNQSLLNRATTAQQKVQSLQLRIKQLEKSNMELMEMRHRQHVERQKMQKIKKSTQQVVEKRLHSKLDEVARLKDQLKTAAEYDQKTRQQLILYKQMLEQARKQKQAEKEQVQQLKEQLTSQRQGLEAVNEEYRLKFTHKVARKKQKNTQLTNNLTKAQQQIHRLHQQNHKLTQQLKIPMQEQETLLQYQQYCRKLEEQRLARQADYLKLLNQGTLNKQKILEQEDIIEQNAAKMQFLLTQIDNLNNKLTTLQNQLHNQPAEELLVENQQQKAQIQSLNSQIQLYTKQIDNLKQQLQETQQQNIFGISQQPYQPYQADKTSTDILQLFGNIKTAIQNIIDGQQISVQFYSQLPLELQKPFQDLMQQIKDKMVGDLSIQFFEERDYDELLEQWQRYLQEQCQPEQIQPEHQSAEQLRRQLRVSQDQIEELRHASQQHQKTIQVITSQHLDKEQQNEQRHILQLTVMKQQLKKLKLKVDSDEMQLETTKKCFMKILDTVFDDQNNLEEDLAEEFQHLCATTKLTDKEVNDLQNYFKKYVILSQKQKRFIEALKS